MSRSLRYFALSSFISVSIAALLLAIFSQSILNRTLLEYGQEQNQAIASVINAPVKALAHELIVTSSHEQRLKLALRLDQDLSGLMPVRGLRRFELFAIDGRLLYRNALLEASNGLTELQLQALSTGRLPSELRTLSDADQISRQVVTWIPLRLNGLGNDAVLAIATDVSVLSAFFDRHRYALGIAAALVILLLFGVLYFSVRYADRELEKQRAALQSDVAEQNRAKQVLQQRGDVADVLKRELEERRQVEQSLRDKEAYLQAVMANIFNAIVCIDKRGQMLSFNPTAEQMFGYSQQQVIGKNVSLLMPAEHAQRHDSYIENYLRTGQAAIIGSLRALKGLRQDGSEFPMELEITEAEVAGEPIFIGTIRDMSDKEQAEKSLFEARQKYYQQEKMAAIGFLSAGLVHEIGNPIAAISGLLDSVCDPGTEHLPCNAAANLQLRMVQEQVERIIKITRDVSEFATPQAKGPDLQDLNNLIGRTCRLMRHDQRFAEIELKLELNNQIPAIYGVGDHLIQVLMNLLVNAVDAVSECPGQPGLILVSTGVEDNRVWFDVSDNGCGMSTEVLSHANEAFYTTKPVGRGTGLGLSLCQSLLNEQGATMTISSQINQGTQIRVTLPTSLSAQDNKMI
ncbi:MAG: PAS domain S-box protein [Motiliproteus sp.]